MDKPEIIIHTELTYKMNKFKEVHNRLYMAGYNAICNTINIDTFLSGAYLRMIVDAAANLFLVNCMSYSLKEKFIDYWMSGKPVNQFKAKVNGNWVQLTTGFIQRNNPHFDRLYKILNPMIHPSKEYLDRIFIEDDKSIYLDTTVPIGAVDDYGARDLYERELKKFEESIEAIQPTSSEFRDIEYMDSYMKATNQAPIIFRIYKY